MDDSLSLLATRLRSSLSNGLELVPKIVPQELAGLTGKIIASLLDQVFAYGFPHLIPDGYVWNLSMADRSAIRLTASTDIREHLLFVGPPNEPYHVIDLLQGTVIWHHSVRLDHLLKAQAETDRLLNKRGYRENDRRLGLLETSRPIPNELVFRNDWSVYCFADLNTAMAMHQSFERPDELMSIQLQRDFIILCPLKDAKVVESAYRDKSGGNKINYRSVEKAQRRLMVMRDPLRYS